jgi:sugar phosphate permease
MNARPSPHWLAKCFKGRLRWFLIGWMFVVSAVAYLDRVNISIAGQAIQRDYGLTDVQLGWVFSAFLISGVSSAGRVVGGSLWAAVGDFRGRGLVGGCSPRSRHWCLPE